ncbi:DoxX family protein [Streptomyces mirabilis]|uniref:DoxX family protein n=1 Tax=Streptomyces mirabilis TaxID=68239 RepID=UPI00365CD331
MTSASLVSVPPVQRLTPVAPLIIRLVVGSVLIAHGFHFSPAEFGGFAAQEFGLPFPGLIGWGVTLLLFVGGGLLVVGLLSRLIAIAASVHMMLGIFLWDIKEGFAPQAGGGVQIPLLLLAGLLLVLLSGPGPFSIDKLLGWDDGWSRPRTLPAQATTSADA